MLAALASVALVLSASPAAASPPVPIGVVPASVGTPATDAIPSWSWPLAAPRVVAPYVQPPHPYAAGHRGVDLRGGSGVVTAPADGVVAFAGTVVDRGVLTIDHGSGWVSSFEPVTTSLQVGTVVTRGQEVALLATGGHAAPGTLHLGARHEGDYVNPLLLLGGVPRAVLLPCC
jgi:murein DD-endopeptidase MepM/ murein hydrolase activator NlpD